MPSTTRHSRAARVVAGLFALALAFVAYTAYVVYAPFGPVTETFVDIPSGTGSAQIAAQLEQAHIIRSRLAFELLRLAKGGTLHAGEYRFDHPTPPAAVYARLRHGDTFALTLSLPEGYNLFDIAHAAEAAGLGPHDAFLTAARQNTALITDIAPHATSLEGFLFPATYRFSRHATPAQMLTAMVRRFRQATTQLGLHPNRDADIARIVTLASLVEKEVGVQEERPLVAGVFVNRLAREMPLETDPSVIYAALLEGRYRGTIYRSDLNSPSPYNTYKHPGLPPGPICSPGIAALRAAIAPAQTPFLYFVSDANGHTRFSATLAEHEQQVKTYRHDEAAHALHNPMPREAQPAPSAGAPSRSSAKGVSPSRYRRRHR